MDVSVDLPAKRDLASPASFCEFVEMDLLGALKPMLLQELPGLRRAQDGSLWIRLDLRYAELVLAFEHDAEAGSIRIHTRLPIPPGAGIDFLLWCLSLNVQYWDVKLGIDAEGLLVVHADVDADESDILGELSETLLDRCETLFELLDEDFVNWLLEAKLGTPQQRERWKARPGSTLKPATRTPSE